MPKLEQAIKTSGKVPIKLCYIADSGFGKTGSLVSLAQAGYRLRILELDNGLDSLAFYAKKANVLDKIEYVQFRDKVKMNQAGVSVSRPITAMKTMQALEKWPEDGSIPAEWGTDDVLVLDSLTNFGRAAHQYARSINPTVRDKRQWFNEAQQITEDLIANLTNPAFNTNVLVLSHVELTENDDGTTKGYISSIGKALGPKLPRFFNTLLVGERKGTGSKEKRLIHTRPTTLVDAKTPAPEVFEATYPIEDGLAQIFETLSHKPN